ncbi:CoA-acylating methylmalonate-semialdehyde dehydrogenase [Pseudoxanthomonas indica]|uniref:methylmalonate-semialdehyde dehydrogenase (CoA acylating) n=1 Tax=Pseudoxanthomonas indica TaxID=428993 RepID=A0A1T5LR30_9GAMM|nr:CoA-acylating methylmalonate-semialdehyde dehydrogenase [Pseudoxanthomonas indica]GGD38538.1 methylmalonate-semialdehyde dehydrogenase (acylating) [Pseudoxanthomonas indica]SKC78446.1 malonate-semialdehyde dehydrogenase (acetylating) / methylmalonate-semialdehyde dehydrogenase [Pseudoxanthomonas indica]
MPEPLHHYVNGHPIAGNSGRSAEVFDPATGHVSAFVPLASRPEVEHAVASAHAAFPAWAETTPLNRARVLFRFKELLERHADDVALRITYEHGKVLSDARGEVTRGLEVVEFACGIPHLLKGEHSMNVGREVDSWTEYAPLGVCAGITPFNFPAMVPLWMFPVALACGNTFVLKPSERDPSASLLMADLLKQAGLPDGVFNVVHGDKEAVDALLDDRRVQAVSFVGSTPIAEYIYARGSANGKRVQALGGAKNHMVVLPDADIDGAVAALLGAGYGSAGERCMAISVAVCVGEATADALVEKLAPKVAALKIGPGAKDPEMGPLVTAAHRAKVQGYVDLGVEEGAKLVIDGRGLAIDDHADGFYLGGCLFDFVTPDMRIYQEEIFGPVLCVVRVPDFETALALVNEHEYGNGTALFTRDGGAAREFAHRVQAGMVGINVPIPVPMAFHSFGGWKRSLFGPLHVHGPDGVRFYTRLKTITARWPEGARHAEFVMPTMK